MADPTSSFIPKNANKVKKLRTTKRIYIFSYISYVLFFGTLIVVLGTYVYNVQVKNSLEEHKQLIAAERESFTEGDIAQVRDLEKRLVTAERLINESSAPSRIFTELEGVVADTVRFAAFEYEHLENNDFKLTFSGLSESFDSAMFQRGLLSSAPILASAALSTYIYGENQEGTNNAPEDGTRLEFVFEGTGSTSLFPYEPVQEIINTTEFDQFEETDAGIDEEFEENNDSSFEEETDILDEVNNN
ncbi:MAG: hypothetical protein WDZ68_00340 [Candidatus Paceibacterota bacterium]